MSIAYDPAPPGAGDAPTFPPLLTGVGVPPGVDPFEKAIAASAAGAEAGTVFWSPDVNIARAAVVLAPDVALGPALAMHFAAAAALNDSIGALAPPEVGLHHVWPDGIKINGAWCGAMRVASDARDLAALPDWLVAGWSLSIEFPTDADPGDAPDFTSLREEGCAEITHIRLIESWARHFLTWLHDWQEDGASRLFDAWRERAEGRGDEVVFEHDGGLKRGIFAGLDETGGMVLQTSSGVEVLPIETILDHPRAWPPESEEIAP